MVTVKFEMDDSVASILKQIEETQKGTVLKAMQKAGDRLKFKIRYPSLHKALLMREKITKKC